MDENTKEEKKSDINIEEIKARAEQAERALAELKENDKKTKLESKKRQEEEENKKTIEQGKYKEAFEKAQLELKQLKEEKESIETATRERIEKTILGLSKEQQEEINLVKDSLPLAKLDAFVSSKLSKITTQQTAETKTKTTTPAPGVTTSISEKRQGHQIDPTTKEILQERFAKPRVYELAENLGVDSVGKFGWKRSDNEAENKGAFIHLLDSMKAIPVGFQQDDVAYQRVLKKG